MDPQILERLERIAGLGISLIPAPEITTHFLFERDGFVVLVERRGEGFGGIGSPGKLVEGHGFAALVRRGSEDWFVARGSEWRAQPGEAEAARKLFTDLKAALGS
ncbi:MAG: hypothetical protein NZR01_06300 [Bryobacteraceae bacterium]|nr:hypothetical protein [Bryobacteraceae bacterium]